MTFIHPQRFKLYHYWRSSASWRVRWLIDLKKIPVEFAHIQILNGEVDGDDYKKRNPLGLLPTLEFIDEKDPNRRFLTESLAIIRYLEETVLGVVSVLPVDPYLRARAWALAEIINSDTAPLQGLGPQALYSDDPAKKRAWALHWIRAGFDGYEELAKQTAGKFSVGDALTIADLCLIPQIYNALRLEMTLEKWPTIKCIWENVQGEPTFLSSHPAQYEVPVRT